MKKILFILCAIVLIAGCEQESIIGVIPENENLDESGLALGSPLPKIDICHYDNDNDTWHILNVNENAWPAHENHGDVRLDDQDGDGFVPSNACDFGQQGDCDDQDFDVNPGAQEICDNVVDDDCDGYVDGFDDDCVTNCVDGELEVLLPDGSTLFVYPNDNGLNVYWGELNTDIVELENFGHFLLANTDFNGFDNTVLIVSQLNNWNDGNYAANLCATLSSQTGCDWYLPSAGELEAMYQQLGPAGNNNFDLKYYWSSTEFNGEKGWTRFFGAGSGNTHRVKQNGFDVMNCRCVRK